LRHRAALDLDRRTIADGKRARLRTAEIFHRIEGQTGVG
jgi:hypothetical protein